MKGRTTLILLLVVLALGTFIVFVERQGDSTEERIEQARKAFQLPINQVNGFTLQRGDLVVRCEREEGEWYIRTPISARADSGLIDRMLYGLQRIQKGEVITAHDRRLRDMTLVDYALDNPQIRMDLQMDGPGMQLLIGRKAPLDSSVYVMEKGHDDVLAVDALLLNIIPSTMDELRDKALFAGEHRRVRRLGIRRADGYLQLAKDDNGKWSIQQPFIARANQKAVHEFIDVLLSMRIRDFIADDVTEPAAFGVNDEAIQVSVWANGDEAGRILLLGNTVPDYDDEIYAKWKNEPTLYAIPSVITNLVTVEIDALRDPHLIAMTPSEITDVQIRKEDRMLKLQKQADETWLITEPVRERADKGRIEGLLYAWASARVTFFLPQTMTNEHLSAPRQSWEVALTVDGSNFPERILSSEALQADIRVSKIGQDSKTVMAEIEAEGLQCMIDGQVLDYLSVDPLFYRSRRVLNLDESGIRRVMLLRKGQEQSVSREDPEKPFVGSGRDAAEIDHNAVEAMVRIGSHLDASSFVMDNPRDLSVFGLDEPRAVLTFGLSGDAGISKAILFGGDSYGGEVYAMVRGQDIVFKLDKTIVNILTRDLFEPQESVGEETLESISQSISPN